MTSLPKRTPGMTKYHTTGKSSLVNTGSHSYRQGTTDAEMGREMASVVQ